MKFTRNTLKRALRTFFQSALAYLCVNLPSLDFSEEGKALKCAVLTFSVSALAAGISAVMNLENESESENFD